MHILVNPAMNLLRSSLFNIFYIAWTALLSICLVPLLIGPRRGLLWLSWFYPAGVLVALRVLCNIRVEIRGHEHIAVTPVIYAAKHQSALDILILLNLLKHSAFVIKKELICIPLFGLYLLHFGMIPIDRSRGTAAMKRILRNADKRVAEQRCIVIYPEGTRTAPGEPTKYQPGVAALYKHLALPVIPVAVNTGTLWGRNAFIKTPGTAIVEFLPPILPGQNSRNFMASLEAAIEPATTKLLAMAVVSA